MAPTLHHLQVSQSERIVWLLEELGVDYILKLYQRAPLLCPPALADLTPARSAPVLTDTHQGREFTISESGAIAEYIITIYGDNRFTLPPSAPNYPEYLFWLHFANGTLQPTLGRKLISRLSNPGLDSPYQGAADAAIARCLGAVEARLSETKAWLAGDEFTAADIMSVFCFTTERNYVPVDLSPYPALLEYLQRVGKREGYRKAMSKGDAEMDIDRGLSAKGPEMFPALAAMEKQMGIGQVKAKA